MKKIYKTAFIAMASLVMLAACGNAGAKTNATGVKDEKGKAVTELDSEGFNSKVYDMTLDETIYLGDKPAIVDFTATWCGPCQRIAPILESLAKEYDGKIVVYKVDVDKERELAKAFNVSSIPAVLYIPTGDGETVMTIGSRDAATISKEIETILLGNQK